MKRTWIQLTDDQIRGLKDRSVSENKSMDQLIREAVDALLRSEIRPNRAAIRRRAIEAAGKFNSGSSDRGSRHDDYLSESFTDCHLS